ncbi:lysophospholipase NTE1 [Kluyveromyces marxianus]|uniref:Lysophospholipase NTE1 n=1 Tax=Kluyveromyces marxianus TaxID=4911 RepID=A0ABX6EYA6_KLUMA|nr:lysophospholipase NTE1 [Kluyveromyces marxianus]
MWFFSYFLPKVKSILLLQFHITLPLNYLVILLIGTVVFTYLGLRSRVLSNYSNLKNDVSDENNINRTEYIDASSAPFLLNHEKHKGFTSYLDEFLSAIKIFGYLEKPVFHELTKSMKTEKLQEGEIILLDDSIGFTIVVEGTLQILHKVENRRMGAFSSSQDFDSPFVSPMDDDGYLINGERFQLLNIVKSGNPLSSLVSILKLFSNSPVQPPSSMQDEERAQRLSTSGDSSDAQSPRINITGHINSFLDSTVHHRFNTTDGSCNTINTNNSNNSNSTNNINNSNTSSNDNRASTPISPIEFDSNFDNMSESSSNTTSPKLPELIARASSDCTIAIIPSSSFQRLLAKYPRSASHIIQMILTKLYRVTFQTAHTYLGLTNEIIFTEFQSMNKDSVKLPEVFRRSIIGYFTDQQDNSASTAKSKKQKRPQMHRLDSNSSVSYGSRHVVLNSRDQYNPGDLLSNVPLPRLSTPQRNNLSASTSSSTLSTGDNKPKLLNNFSTSHFEETETSSWRLALIDIIFQQLDITKDTIQRPVSDNISLSEQFPDDQSLRRRSSYSSFASLSSSVATQSSNRLVTFLPKEAHQFSRLEKKGNKLPKLRKNLQEPNVSRSREEKTHPLDEHRNERSNNDGQFSDFETVKEDFSKCIKILRFEGNETILYQNSNPQGIFYVVSGEVDVISETTNPDTNESHERILYTVSEGFILGCLSSILGCKSLVSLKVSKGPAYLALIPYDDLERLCDKYFMIYLRLSEMLTNSLSPNLLRLDYFLEWIHLDSSQTLFNQGDPANGVYLVLNGRLRQLFYEDEESDVVTQMAELSKGESFGEVEVLTAINRLNTVVAIRESELARIPRTLFEFLAIEHPSIMIHVSRMVAKKAMLMNFKSGIGFTGTEKKSKAVKRNTDDQKRFDFNLNIKSNQSSKKNNSWSNTVNYKTITILPITEGLPVEEFAYKLINALRSCGKSTIGLNQRTTLSHLGRHAFDKLSTLKQSGYFSELEELYEIVVYIADTPVSSSWTQTCISQGDCILLLADAMREPKVGEFERLLLKSKTTARTDLVLIYPERFVVPGSTSKWLKNRIWIQSHHHVQFTPSDKIHEPEPILNNKPLSQLVEKFKENTKRTQESFVKYLPDSIKTTVETLSGKYINPKANSKFYTSVNPVKNDFLRLARILSGQAVGLVLGGGGARGLSHLGIIKALEERGIPVDIIGGTSIGSFVGGLYAMDYDLVPMYGRVKKFAGRVGSVWRTLTDLTWPVTSYTTGHEFNRGIWKTFRDYRIEDFWLPYYCNSTNITESVQEIHTSGVAWRYIRASMSLAGLLPPIVDNGNMLLDGGYVDNLPVTEMKQRGCRIIFAVDVGSVDDRTPVSYGDSLNGFWIILNRWNPFSKHPNIPNMAEIQMRLGYVASVNALERAKNTPGVVYMRPPIENYATLDFGKFEEIYQVGVAYGHDFLQHLQDTNQLPQIAGTTGLVLSDKQNMLQRRNSI